MEERKIRNAMRVPAFALAFAAALFSAVTFFSCENSSGPSTAVLFAIQAANNSNSAKAAKTVTLTGTVGGGAVPSNISASAKPDASDSSRFVYFARAEAKDASGAVIATSKGTFGAAGTAAARKFEIPLEIGKTWTVICGIKDNKGTSDEGDDVEVYVDSFTKNITADEPAITHAFYPAPKTGADETGDVALEISVSGTQTASVAAAWEETGLVAPTVSAISGGKVTISVTGVKAGRHILVVSFKSSSGEVLYSTAQPISVFGGMKTDKWVEDGSAGITSSGFAVDDALLASVLPECIYVGVANGLPNSNGVNASDLNSGHLMEPLASLDAAFKKIEKNGSGSSPYKIFITGNASGEVAGNATLSAAATKARSVTVQSAAGAGQAVLKGDGTDSVITIDSAVPVTFKNIKITGGNASDRGGGIRANKGSSLTLESGTLITGNSAAKGGGIAVGGSLLMKGGEISGNEATDFGGGIFCECEDTSVAASAKISGSAALIKENSVTSTASATVGFGGGLYVGTNASADLTSGQISQNQASNGGGGVAGVGSVSMTGGKIIENTAPGGGAVRAQGSFSAGGLAYIPYGGSAGSNDVCLESGKAVTVLGSLSEHSSSRQIGVSLANWRRGAQIVQAVAGASLPSGIESKFAIAASADDGWEKYTASDKITINAPFFVAPNGKDDDSSYIGTYSKPFLTLGRACREMNDATVDYIVRVNGKAGAQTIPNTLSKTASDSKPYHAKSLLIEGKTGNTADSFDADGSGSALTVESAVPITIKNLKVTGGSASSGGGIYQKAGIVHLSDGAWIAGNTATNGAGVYVDENSKLFVSGSAWIGSKATLTAAATDETAGSNIASSSGGGVFVYHKGALYLGYDGFEEDGTTLHEKELTGGVVGNVSQAASENSGGGGIYADSAANYPDASKVAIASGKVAFNSAKRGGGLYVRSITKCDITGGNVENNEASAMGGGIYSSAGYNADQTGLCISGDTLIKDNKVTGSSNGGGAVAVAKLNGLRLSGAVEIPYGGSANKNDVWVGNISSTYYRVEVYGELTKANVATITPSTWIRGRAVLYRDGGLSDGDRAKFKISDGDFNIYSKSSGSDRYYGLLNAPVYVASSSVTDDTRLVCNAPPNSGATGTTQFPCATIQDALDLLEAGTDGTIIIDGHIDSSTPHRIGTVGSTEYSTGATSVTIKGYIDTERGATTSQAVLDVGGTPSESILTIGTTSSPLPITIQNLTISNGNSGSAGKGGGINMAVGTDVTLAAGAVITDCKAEYQGGGVYNEGGTLRIKGGKITNNHISENSADGNNGGGGLYMRSSSSDETKRALCVMESGEISGNDERGKSDVRGGGIRMKEGATFQMSGGKVSGNKVGNLGGNIFANTDSAELKIEMSGGEISGGVISGSGGDTVAASGDAHGAAVWLEGSNAKMTMSGGEISGNKAKAASNKNACAGVYVNGSTFTMTGGLISENEVTGGNSLGGAVRFRDGTFKMSGAAYIPYGVTVAGATVKGAGKNDVYLADGKIITLDGAAAPTVDGKSGSTAAATAATITLPAFERGKQFLVVGGSYSLTESDLGKFAFSDLGWDKKAYDSDKKAKIDSDIYVAGSSPEKCKTSDGASAPTDTGNTIGTWARPFKSISAALALLDSDHDTIIVDGTVSDQQQSISGTINSSQVTVKGWKASTAGATSNARLARSLTGASTSGSVLYISTAKEVTIEDLEITGGKKSGDGGGIVLAAGTLKLGNNAEVFGNSASANGGGVYVASGAKLFMYGSSLVGDLIGYTATSSDLTTSGTTGCSNTAKSGGGIYNNGGSVYIGYSDASTKKDMSAGYGVCRNYASGGANESAGGIRNRAGTLMIASGSVSYNQSANHGGGIYAVGTETDGRGDVTIESPVTATNKLVMYGNKAVMGGAIYVGTRCALAMKAGQIGGSGKQNTATTSGGAIFQGEEFSVSGSALIYPSTTAGTNDVFLPKKTSTNTFVVTANSTMGNNASSKMPLTLEEYKRGTQIVYGNGVTVNETLWNKFALTRDDGDWEKYDKTVGSGASAKDYVAITADVFVAGSSETTVSDVTYKKGLTIAEGALGTKSKPFKFISDALGVFEDSTTPAVVTVVGTTSAVAQEIPSTFTTSKASALTLKGLSSSSPGIIRRYTTTPASTAANGSALTVNSDVPVTIQDITITGGNAINGGGINITKGTVILSDGAKITGNIADTNGGGVYVAGSDGKLLMRGKSLIGDDANPSSPSAATSSAGGYANKAASGAGIYNNGGAVYLGYTLSSSGTPTTAGGTLVNNSSYGYYGVRHNYATTSGGGIYLASGTLEMGSGFVAYNQAASSAGGIYFANGATLEGGKIEGNQSKSGGGIYIDASKEVILKSVSLSSNKVSATNQDVYGGAVYNNGTLKIQNAIDVNANSGLATGHTAYGGAFYNKAGAEINITGGVRVNNNSATFGGAFYNSGTLILSNGTVGTGTMNTATSSGGAVYQNGTFKVSASAKIYNESQAATKNDVYLSGTTKYVTLEASLNTSGNTSTYPMLITPSRWYRGDKVLDGYSYISANYTKFKVSDTEWSLVSHGTSTNIAGKIDADIWVAGSGTLTSCSNPGNDSTGNGTKAKPYASITTAVGQCWGGPKDTATGGRTIFVEGTVTAATNTEQTISSSITSAKATAIKLSGNGSGVKLQAASGKRVLSISTAVPVTITNMTISGGSTTSNGAGIYVSAAKASLTLTTSAVVTGNSTTAASGKGGGIYIAGTSGAGNAANLIMNGTSSISANSATGTSGVGGGVYLSYANLCMSGDALIGDTSGSVAATSTSTGHSNMAKNGGGVYCDTGSNVYLGFASASDSGTSLSKGIRHNYASSCGGGIYVNGGSVTLKTGYVSYNGTAATSDCDGGGIWQKSGTTVTISGGTIAKNKGYFGGGVYAGGTFTMSGGTIGDSSDKSAAANTTSSTNYSNYAAYGGGIYAPSGASVSVTSGYVSYNYATVDGGGIMAIPSFTFSANANYNQAAGSGGGIRCGSLSAQGGITISSGVIKGNKGLIGGGVYVKGVMTMSGGSINSNTATTTDSSDDGYNGGGGVFVEDYRFVMSGGTISGNESKSHGGGVFLQDANLYMSGGAVIGSSASSYPSNASSASNKAAGKGGGIYSNIDSIIYLGYTYSSTSSGAPLYNATTASFTGGLCNNFSSGDGGGIYCNGSGGVKMRLGYIKCNNANSKNGGGINFARGSNILLTGGEISSNYAKNGGGIYVGNTNPTINGTTMSSNQVTNAGCGGAVYVANETYAGLTFAGSGKIVAGTGPTINTVYLETGAKISVDGSNPPTSATVATIIPYTYSSDTQVMDYTSASACAAKFKVWPTSSDNWLVQNGGYIDKGSRVTSASDAAAAIRALSSGKSARIIIECSVSDAAAFFSTIKAALLSSSACISLDLTGVTGLTEVSNNAFYGGATNCASLYSVKLPSTITRIGTNAFANCTNLGKYYNGSLSAGSQTVLLPASCTEIGAAAFYNCYLNHLDLEHVNTLYTSACVGWTGTGNKTVSMAFNSGETAKLYTGSSYTDFAGTYNLPLAMVYSDYLGYGDGKLVRQ